MKNSAGIVLIELTRAKGLFARMKGLLGSDSLPDGTGLLLEGRQVHTIGLRYTIDAIYLAADGSVLAVRELVPWRLGPLVPRAKWIVELAVGTASRKGIRERDVLRIEGDVE